jgi:energy-coupling factor transport system permease protein
MFDARVWLLWALATLVTASMARNPLYALLLLLITTLVGTICSPDQGDRAGSQRTVLSPFRFAAIVIPLSALFNALTVHFGDTVLLHLPDWLPLLGGPVTLEALVFGALNGLVLTVIFSAFAVFNQVTPIRDLVGLTPRAFHAAGVIASIALTFVPQTASSLKRIRQAQAVRGHRARGMRDWLPIVMPLLISGLERSMGLAEAMVARGYGAVSDRAHPLRTSGGLVLGLMTLLVGWLIYLFWPAWRNAGVGLLSAAAVFIGVVLWYSGRSVRHTVYRPRRWTARDSLVVVGCLQALLAVTMLPSLVGHDTLYYSPYPRLVIPEFDPLIGLGLMGLLMPAIVGRQLKTGDGVSAK